MSLIQRIVSSAESSNGFPFGLVAYLWAVPLVGGAAAPASASISQEKLADTELGGLRLGMRIADVEAIIRSHTDASEVRGGLDSSSPLDCEEIVSPSTVGARWSFAIPPSDFSFETLEHGYNIAFRSGPNGPVVASFSVTNAQSVASWEDGLAAAERKFGAADAVIPGREGQMAARWCVDGEASCGKQNPAGPYLMIAYHPFTSRDTQTGGGLRWILDEGNGAREARVQFWDSVHSDSRARLSECMNSKGKYFSDRELDRHLTSLTNLGPKARKAVWEPLQVPAAAFEPLGITQEQLADPGICFNSMDFIIETPGCRQYTSVRFVWARPVGDVWLFSFKHGGASYHTRYEAVRRSKAGSYKKVWTDESLSGFASWYANGKVPLLKP